MSPFPTIVDWTGVSTLGLESDGDGSSNAPYALPDPEQPGSIKMALDRSGPTSTPTPAPSTRTPNGSNDWPGGHRGASCLWRRLGHRRRASTPNTPDGEFVLDRLGPIVVGSPCSGHGFKFAPLIGKILADMATGSPVGVRLDAFRAGREWTRRHMADRAFDV